MLIIVSKNIKIELKFKKNHKATMNLEISLHAGNIKLMLTRRLTTVSSTKQSLFWFIGYRKQNYDQHSNKMTA